MKKRKKSKKKKSKLILIVILIFILSTILYTLLFNKDILEYRSKITIEVGEAIPTLKEFIYNDKNVNDEINWHNITSTDGHIYVAGTYTGTFKYQNEEKQLTLIVKDTTPPVIEGYKDIEMLAYEKEPDILEGVTVSDNSLEDIDLKLEGTYDSEKVGEYILSISAEDSSGNITRKKIKLTVKENQNVKISKTSKGYQIKNYHGITYIDDVIIANKTYNLPSNFAPNNLVAINGYIKVVDYVKKAFTELTSDAASIGLNIYASSGYRSYNNQEYIYNNYVRMDGKEKADTYSARAGHSEHQTGLAIDVNSINMSFDNTNESNWLKENCHKYGFIIRYPKDKENITGYMYEPWHIRYVGKSFANTLYNNGNWISLEEYFGINSRYTN